MKRRPKEGSIRNVVTGGSDGYGGRVAFARLGVTCAFSSMLEGDFLSLTAAYEADVVEINSQPCRLTLHMEDGESFWTPDYRVLRASGARELVEVKPVEDVHPERARTQRRSPFDLAERMKKATAWFSAMRQAAAEAGYQFRLVTEDEIRIEPRLANAALILRYAGHGVPDSWLMQARVALATSPITSVDALQASLSPNMDAFALALHLAWRGELELDRTRLFCRESRFVRVGHRVLDPSLVH